MIIYLIIFGTVLCFCAVLLVGAPYVPTLSRQKKTALDMLDLKPGQILYELGSGDGRILKAAAERGIKTVGIELNPLLVLVSYIITIKQRKNVRIIWGNFWKKDIKEADGIFVFLLDKYMVRLDKKIKDEHTKTVKLASYAFAIPAKKAAKEHNGVFLYKY